MWKKTNPNRNLTCRLLAQFNMYLRVTSCLLFNKIIIEVNDTYGSSIVINCDN